MKCEKCNEEHDGSFGSGRFCNVKCANSFSTMNDDKIQTKQAVCIECGRETNINKRASIKTAKCEECKPPKFLKVLGVDDIERKGFCLYCNSIIPVRNRFCNTRCFTDYKDKVYIEKWKSGKVDGSKSHGNAISSYVRGYLWKKYGDKCSRCGWNTPNPVTGRPVLEIEHIDGNSTNNDEENLDLICPNCHSLTTTYRALNIGNGNKKRLRYYGLIK